MIQEKNETTAASGRFPSMVKVEKYGWIVKDHKGTMLWLPKETLHVDVTYQRDKVVNGRVLDIAKAWSWVACGVLIIGRRADGTYWVIDGQHRKLAADKRIDIQDLPCVVFDVDSIHQEARGFVDANTARGPVPCFAKFKAMVVADDPIAAGVSQMVEATGYRISDCGARHTVQCVRRLRNCYARDKTVAARVWQLCTELFDGHPVRDDVLGGLFALERFLHARKHGSILDKELYRRILAAKPSGLIDGIRKARAYYEKGGEAVWAQGILNVLNFRRTSGRIPSIITEG